MKTIFLCFVLLSGVAFGQAGNIDPTFNQYFYDHFGNGNGFGAHFVNGTAEQPDGKLLICGSFNHYNGVPAVGVARLFPDGQIDPTFTSLLPVNSVVECIILQPDGKILVGGSTFGAFNGILRLNANGSVDNTFTSPLFNGGYIYTIALQSTGKILIGGTFTTVDGMHRYGFARLNANGSPDAAFDATNGMNTLGLPDCNAIHVFADDKILVQVKNSYLQEGLSRLNEDGTVDPAFDNGNGPMLNGGGFISHFSVCADEKIIIVGNFTSVYGQPRSNVARLHSDGTLDNSFIVGVGPNATVSVSCALTNGQVLIGGHFSLVNGVPRNRYARLNSDGSVDAGYNIGEGFGSSDGGNPSHVNVIRKLQNGNTLVAGFFDSYNLVPKHAVTCLDDNATTIPFTFIVRPGADRPITNVSVYPDNKIFISGSFEHYNGIKRRGMARLNADGTLDESFDPLDGFDGLISTHVLQPDGKILVAGTFTQYNGSGVATLARLNTDGTLDISFDVGTGTSDSIIGLCVQPDGKILVAGRFTSFNGINVHKMLRLGPDGSIDNSFLLSGQIQPDSYNEIQHISLQSDGKILIAGYFQVLPSYRNYARLNADGSLDNGFALLPLSINSDYHRWRIAAGSDGTTVLAGHFHTVEGNNADGLMAVYPDGTLKEAFEVESETNYRTYSFLIQPNGKIIVGGAYTTNGPVYPDLIQHQVLRRMHADGSLDTDFITDPFEESGNLPTNVTYALAFINDGSLITVGTFKGYGNYFANHIARLSNDIGPITSLSLSFTNIADITCEDPGTVTANAQFGMSPYIYEWLTVPAITTSTLTITDPGVYNCVVTDGTGTILTQSLLISGPRYDTAPEMNSNLGATGFRPGFTATAWIDAFNDGCVPVSGQLKLTIDPQLDFVSSNPAPTSSNGDTLIWNFSNMTYDSQHLTPQLLFETSTLASIGDSIRFTTVVTPVSGDANPSNNVKHYVFPVVNGYDPNTKSVYPVGKCDVGYIEPDQLLTYTIHFQNTGNSEAINIAVVDSLDADLDVNTVRVIGKSHDMWTEVLPGNVLKFHFDNIWLPDSTSNEPESHGYVIYEVKPVTTWLPHNTEIANKAEIYFDFNPAIVTNTVSNLVYQDGDLDSYGCFEAGIAENNVVNVLLFPNPTTGSLTADFGLELAEATLIVTDIRGNEVLGQPVSGKTATIDLSTVNAGIYFLSVYDESGKIIGGIHKISKING